ncbi:haloacid dehalogenase-like hydrolase [Grosmannia clavigera kw1407]|uniref:Haloacid dehalogenase-like hydrolase n=1 Tax=Grosmannia clavigera (strain kw1407 / UAMH 11150) TaxID=655863 RepID=F0XNM0_GROCL|nr:haloacid dehalogenase-like hydrolase [Grosmannia clavigera kw1407]EFX00413.1 haloacid dehalogenase-like hydrolase [Grosmannia clavigera kw1407]
MACCAVAAYIVWRLVSLHDRLFQMYTKSEEYLCEKEKQDKRNDAKRPSQQYGRCILTVRGLSCSSCVRQIEAALQTLPAVRCAQVSLVLLRASVEYDPRHASSADLVAAIHKAGYEAQEDERATAEYGPNGRHGCIRDMVDSFSASEATWEQNVAQHRHDFKVSVTLAAVSWIGSSAFAYMTQAFPSSTSALPALLLVLQAVVALACLAVSRRVHMHALQSVTGRRPRTVETLASAGMLTAMADYILVWCREACGNREPHVFPRLGGITMLCTSILGVQLLKTVASRHSLGQVTRLASLFPHTAAVLTASKITESTYVSVDLDMLVPGDTCRIGTGDRLPADGHVLSGTAWIDETWMTGDHQPKSVDAASGDAVFAGCTIIQGDIVVCIDSCGPKSRLGQLLERVLASEQTTGSVEHGTGLFVDTILLLVIVATATSRLVQDLSWTECRQSMTSMLVCACPCTLELGESISLISAAASAAKANIRLHTNPRRIEDAGRVKTVLLDKTGTLTTGVLSVSWCGLAPHWMETEKSRAEWWALVGAVEQHDDIAAKHPLARAILREAQVQAASASAADSRPRVSVVRADYEPGRGVHGWLVLGDNTPAIPGSSINARHVVVGSRSFLAALGIEHDMSSVPETARADVATTVCVAIDRKHAGTLVCRDVVRPSALELVRRLSQQGVRVGMITGDAWSAALRVAGAVGISVENVHAELLPLDKAGVVLAARRRGPVVVVGDNLNDTGAFAESSFSIYVGSDTVCAGETDAMLLSGQTRNDAAHVRVDLEQIQDVILLAKTTMDRIRQNRWASLAYNIVALALASGLLQNIHHRLYFSPYVALL